VLALSGSQGAVAADHVKDIEADKMGYLKSRFSTGVINKSVLETVTKADNASVNFSKLVFTIIPHIVKSQSTVTPPDYRTTLTYISIGGPFVDTLEELSSNGFPTTQTFFLTYRGILNLETQSVTLSAKDAPPDYTVKNLKEFSALAIADAGVGSFEWRYQNAPHIQLMNFKDTYFHCTYGAVYPASKINAQLKGNAQDLDCEIRNDNNIVTDHSTRSVLQYYGISIPRSRNNATSTIEFTVEDVQIE
jgi:hypothetical protein